ncbi:VPS10 domain-containing protein [Gaopeijia maritima]|uniref:VPS10 domain-containing protein n=1 Tax=Gaopeijia maritima TaxID=3119007 RepID=UPI00326F8673
MAFTNPLLRFGPTALGAALLLPLGLAGQVAIETADLTAFQPREIGPAVTGGRIHDVEADPADPSVLYIASASGGLWKTTTRGHTWTPLTDHLPVSTFGDVALAPSNTEIVYAGTGEQNNRQSTSWGNGVYRSDDGGANWRHLGLDDTRHIGKLEIDPSDPDVVFVAALGNLWAPGGERGVYRTRDGGASWDQVLAVDEYTGAVDLVMDPSNPDVLYAATYQRQRRAWGFNGGGPGSGIYKTTDGGDSWTELTNGIPSGDKGRIGLALAASNPRVLNALIETADDETTGTYRSEDGGATWTRVNELDIRPMYYSEIFIDPTNPDRVYTMATSSHRSEDGGRNFTEIAVRPTYDVGVHADQHALWIDPTDPSHLYMGGDAGLHESYDYGTTWRKINNIPISQFYAIGVDMGTPYRVYGGLQDNHSFVGPSETRRWVGIVNDDWQQVGFGDGMFWAPDPFDTDVAYGSSNGGNYFRLHARTGDMIDISPEAPAGEEGYRFDWTSPIIASKHDPNTVYVAGNRFFASRDRGSSWTRSEDLSRRIDRDTLEIMGLEGGDITISRNDGTSSFGEAVALVESPVDAAVLWVGFDDGNLQVTRDGGRTFTEVSGNVEGVADGTYVSRVVPSTRGAGVAYATFDAHRDGDFAPYIFRTDDFGATWTPVHDGLPSGSVLSMAEHPDNPDVLFAGTEHHLFVSTDAGGSWARMPNLPTTAYDDIIVHPREKDLVLGTHGRGIWILDDTEPLAEWTADAAAAPAHLFSIPDGTIFVYWKDTSYRADAEYAGTNPRNGTEITYRLGAGSGSATLTVTRADGTVVRRMEVPSTAGTHRINWDLRWSRDGETERWEPWTEPRLARPTGARGFFVAPGSYTVSLEARGTTISQTVRVLPDPMVPTLTIDDYLDREAFLLEVRDLMRRLDAGVAGMAPQSAAAMGRTLNGVFNAMNGSGVRPGTIHPPTASQREAVAAVREAVSGGGQ